jgi:hypothetical protein
MNTEFVCNVFACVTTVTKGDLKFIDMNGLELTDVRNWQMYESSGGG